MNRTKVIKYSVEARRDENEVWSDWTMALDLDKAAEHLKRVEELGYCGQIVERRVEVKISEVVKALLRCRTKQHCSMCVYQATKNCTACMAKDAAIIIRDQSKEIDRLTLLLAQKETQNNA